MTTTPDTLLAEALEHHDLTEAERRVLDECQTEGGRFWAGVAFELVRRARQCKGPRSRSAMLDLIQGARGCFKTALDADKPAAIREIQRLADLLERANQEASGIDALETKKPT